MAEFDVEDYRADLQRRVQYLHTMEHQYHRKFVGAPADSPLAYGYSTDAERCMNKAKGIEIALSLLPQVVFHG